MYEFVKNTQTIYDPMVYVCETDLDFAFNDTILPIVKSKLLDVVNGLYPYI